MNILILYAEIMPYNVACFEAINKINKSANLYVFNWGSDKKLTPFVAPNLENVHYFEENKCDINYLINFINYCKINIVYVCGRTEKKYLKFLSKIKDRRFIVIGTTDEQFSMSIKNIVKYIFSYYLYRQYFEYIMVPGPSQYQFVRALGYKEDKILQGSYSTNVNEKNIEFNANKRIFNNEFKLLYVGRLSKEKGILELCEAIEELCSEDITIKLKIIGNGNLKSHLLKYNFVEIINFLDHQDLYKETLDIRFFILPSIFEPWGVVVHEMCSWGLPLILSDKVGSRFTFLDNYRNGFIFKSGQKKSLKKVIKISHDIDSVLWNEFSNHSIKKSKSITNLDWGNSITNLCKLSEIPQ